MYEVGHKATRALSQTKLFVLPSGRPATYSSQHQTACLKATEGLHPFYGTALSHQYNCASVAALQDLSCLYSPGSAVRVAILYDFAVDLNHALSDSYCSSGNIVVTYYVDEMLA